MTTKSTAVIDKTIHAAAIAKGFFDATVVTQTVQDRFGALDVGSWFVLSVNAVLATSGNCWAAPHAGRADPITLRSESLN